MLKHRIQGSLSRLSCLRACFTLAAFSLATGCNFPELPPPEDEPEVPEPAKIDLLVVLDNSGSMVSEQQALESSIPGFVEELRSKLEHGVDLHVGVVTTGGLLLAESFGAPGCEQLGAIIQETQGANSSNASCGPYTDGLRFLNGPDDFDEALRCASRPGTGGDGNEKPIAAMLAALSPELATPACNGKFSRDDALLVVTIVTDEEDDELGQSPVGDTTGSEGDPSDWHDALVDLKGGDEDKIVALGLIGTEESTECDPLLSPSEDVSLEGAQVSERLEAFVKSFGEQGLVGDVCAPSYEEFFGEAAKLIRGVIED